MQQKAMSNRFVGIILFILFYSFFYRQEIYGGKKCRIKLECYTPWQVHVVESMPGKVAVLDLQLIF